MSLKLDLDLLARARVAGAPRLAMPPNGFRGPRGWADFSKKNTHHLSGVFAQTSTSGPLTGPWPWPRPGGAKGDEFKGTLTERHGVFKELLGNQKGINEGSLIVRSLSILEGMRENDVDLCLPLVS